MNIKVLIWADDIRWKVNCVWEDFVWSLGLKLPCPIRRVLWLTFLGTPRCLNEHRDGGVFCKRRKGHWGKHRTGDRSLDWPMEGR